MSIDKLNNARPPFVLLENSRQPEKGALAFTNPIHQISAKNIDEITSAFEEIEQALDDGHCVAGYMTYELGLALEPKLKPRLKTNKPLFWFGVFKEAIDIQSNEVESWLASKKQSTTSEISLKPKLDFAEYEKKFNIVKQNIASGDIYQLNLTFKVDVENAENPYAVYDQMRRAQPVAYSSFIHQGDNIILSASPELFIEMKDGWVETRPMKGTLSRTPMSGYDEVMRGWLQEDEKSRAENLMIVDLMRNDLGQISELGTVSVKNLFEVETYRSLHQMISTVRSKLKKDLTFLEILTAIFPPGSITGAPKIRAMELIDELEGEPRSLYTGSIGYIAPNRDAVFNVAIRTIELGKNGQGEIGIGSGLVIDSDVRQEFDECLLKMRFLNLDMPDFSLIETIGSTPERGLILLERHMERLESSAQYFNFPFPGDEIKTTLHQMVADNKQHLRIRVTLNKSGSFSLTPCTIKPLSTQEEWQITLAETKMDNENPFLYHKTTNREFYDYPRKIANRKKGVDEVIFMNKSGEITEGSITNIFVRDGEILKTPPLECGLLAGTLRAELLATGAAIEKKLTIEDLKSADEIYVGNSVRGLIKAKLI